MVEEGCTCDEGLGVAHSHLVYGHTGRPFPWVQVWVDWKKVARAMARHSDGHGASPYPCVHCGLTDSCEHDEVARRDGGDHAQR